MARILASVFAVALCCLALSSALAFLPGRAAPSLRGEAAALALGAGVVAAGVPDAAEAFVYNGKEYFDVTYGIEPAAWFCAGFAIVAFGATVKNAATKYNKRVGAPGGVENKPYVNSKFVGKEIENKEVSYKAL